MLNTHCYSVTETIRKDSEKFFFFVCFCFLVTSFLIVQWPDTDFMSMCFVDKFMTGDINKLLKCLVNASNFVHTTDFLFFRDSMHCNQQELKWNVHVPSKYINKYFAFLFSQCSDQVCVKVLWLLVKDLYFARKLTGKCFGLDKALIFTFK